jgi:hypothetical protein
MWVPRLPCVEELELVPVPVRRQVVEHSRQRVRVVYLYEPFYGERLTMQQVLVGVVAIPMLSLIPRPLDSAMILQ